MTMRDVRTLPQLENLIGLGDTFSNKKVQVQNAFVEKKFHLRRA